MNATSVPILLGPAEGIGGRIGHDANQYPGTFYGNHDVPPQGDFGEFGSSSQDTDDVRSLHRAAFIGNLLDIRHCINRGDSVEKRSRHGKTPLHEAARSGQNLAVMELILYEANVDAVTPHGRTA